MTLASAGPWANHLHFASDRKPRHHLITQLFYRPDALCNAQPTVSSRATVKALKATD